MTAVALSLVPEPDHKPFERADAFGDEVKSVLRSHTMEQKTHSEIEEFINAKSREWGRLLMEEVLELRAMVEERQRVVDNSGRERESARKTMRHLGTVLGRVAVPRLGYQSPGTADLHPMDGVLNLPRELYSHGVRRVVAIEAASVSFDEVVEKVRMYTGTSISKRQVEQLTVRAAQDFDAFYAGRSLSDTISEDLLIISTDGKGIVMRHEDLRENTKQAAERSPRTVESRLMPGQKKNRKRMAQVATVYSVAPHNRQPQDILCGSESAPSEEPRPRPTQKRVWASVEKEAKAVIREAFDEAQRRDPEHKRHWVVLVDGDQKQLRAVKDEAKRLAADITIIADFVHVLEYIWDAARALFGETSAEAEAWVRDQLMGLLTGVSGEETVECIRSWQMRTALSASAVAAIDKACQYLTDPDRMLMIQYGKALDLGMPIATGVIEGACRYLVKDRMDRCGARWSLTGAEAVLRLRAIRSSHDFDEYWKFHLAQENYRNHASHYEGETIPNPLPCAKPKGRPHLKRIK